MSKHRSDLIEFKRQVAQESCRRDMGSPSSPRSAGAMIAAMRVMIMIR
jgi:hypothetical protein